MSDTTPTEYEIRQRLARFNLSEQGMREQVAQVLNGVYTLDFMERSLEALAFENATRQRRSRLQAVRAGNVQAPTRVEPLVQALRPGGGKTNALQRMRQDRLVATWMVAMAVIAAAALVSSLLPDRNGVAVRAVHAVVPLTFFATRVLLFLPRTRRWLNTPYVPFSFSIRWQEAVRAEAVAFWLAMVVLDPEFARLDLTGPDKLYGGLAFVAVEAVLYFVRRWRAARRPVQS